MNLVVFGLSVSSAWGNGHATLLRGLFRALHARGHQVHFFEKDVPYYAAHRDAPSLPYAHLHIYQNWNSVADEARQMLRCADVGIVTSYCPDGAAACRLILDSHLPRSVFYDMDTPVTLERLARGEQIGYLPEEGLAGFDLVLSYTGGSTLDGLQQKLNARHVAALYGWVDPAIHSRQPVHRDFASDLAYLGTYASDRQAALEALLIAPARTLPQRQFIVAGALFPDRASWPANIQLFEHIAPPDHGRFYSSSPLMLNVTRASMAQNGFCPSGRLFESAACGTAVLSDWWEGLDTFFSPGEEILVAQSMEQAIQALSRDVRELQTIGERARERALDCHTAAARAERLLALIESPAEGRERSKLEVAAAARA